MNAVVAEKIQDFYEAGIPEVFERDLDLGETAEPARGNLATVVTGVRRCGKTFRLYQEMRRIVEAGHPLESILYFNFEDERLKPHSPTLLAEVLDTFYAMRPQAKREGAFLFFDEIQEVPEWGAFLRRVIDFERVTVYVTGSSSKMLSASLASEFRGRAISRELFPMSFSEFVRYRGLELPGAGGVLGSAARARLRHELPSYLGRGGFIAAQGLSAPDAVQLLQEYANRTVVLDVVERYGIRSPVAASRFLSRCLASSGRELSVNKVAGELKSAGLAVSRATLSSLLEYYEEACLLFSVGELSRSLSANPRSASKVYAVDPGMLAAFSPAPARDEGQRLETAVFARLRREAGGLRAGAVSRLLVADASGGRREVGFAVGDALLGRGVELVQATVSMEDERTRRRELTGLSAGMRALGVAEGWVVTMDEEEDVEVDGGVVHVVPAWRWLLG